MWPHSIRKGKPMVSKAPSPHRRNLFTLVLLALLWTSSSLAQQPQLSEVKRTQIEAAVTKYMATTHVPGLSVAVVENGEYEWAAGFGLADAENNAPASEHTLFRPIMLCGQFVLVLPKVRRSHVVVEYGVVGVQRQGFLVVLDSGVVVLLPLLHVAAVVVAFRGLLVLLNGSIEALGRLGIFLQEQVRHALFVPQ